MRIFAVRGLGLVFLALVLAIGARPAQAQQWGIYFTGSGGSLNLANTNNLYGSTFGLYVESAGTPLIVGADFRGVMMGAGNIQGPYTSERLDYGLLGPRIASRPIHARFVPYAEGLFGFGYFAEGAGVARQDHKAGTLQIVGGLDIKIHNHIQWRAAEVTYGRVKGQLYATTPVVISTGVLFQFP